ncbi:MAG: FlaA1/EpsC-like NDP-sugar epimerase [Ascidiaceihabitans sp.]|jgi:FlaA1/EpsC-like NDP-sugar epimerase
MLEFVRSLTQTQKSGIIIGIDSLLIPISLVLAFGAQFGMSQGMGYALSYLVVLPYLLVFAAGLSVWLGISSIQLNAYDTGSIVVTAVFASLLGLASIALSFAASLQIPVAAHVIFSVFLFFFSVLSRATLLQIVMAIYRRSDAHLRVLIYGAGSTGTQLVSALRNHKQIEAVAFVDDNTAMHGLTLSSLPVLTPVRIKEIAAEKKIDRVLLAMPSLTQPKQAQIAHRLQKMGLEVQSVPSFSQLIGEEALVDKLTPVEPHLFLNRDEVSETFNDARDSYCGRNILISGAGGSIGSELCRQILETRPAKLVMFDLSELALFNIDMEVRQQIEGTDIVVVPVLGSISDATQVRKILNDHDIHVVLHAAAYKHVPLVESNPLAGLSNNVLGTQILAQEAASAHVERFVLISSDKAVRPTNVMGASKRLAELVIQDLASRIPEGTGPIFSMVRFGNVLGSSGSVVPLFQDQLRRGGPLTVTHPDVARYFMTVQEAVTLVLRAAAMASGGEVYVLDMGKPVSIERLARQVIERAGYSVKDKENPDGDIEVAFTGLRPGEKMIEELTLTGSLIGTGHKKIFFSDEARLSEIEVAAAMRALREALQSRDEIGAREVARRWVEGYANVPFPTHLPAKVTTSEN